ncbi:uncharacterized protein N7515_000200 [Penicillium bovifimosum]|uniref:Uncharacterized protein n=1 Tax=Penicillium bovifimosum TaxID=126998 RepID=A0A9W9HF25_9EURO|nr:uncharacterized protein N7515_000200 [Penicillium bovifimosum]KAJ5145636.1 hypothetical protein N7515_000200 [Penicillium bovifimosum]
MISFHKFDTDQVTTDIRRQFNRPTQKEDQHPEAFARQLEVLERNWDRGPEKLRAEDYLTKLTDPLPRKITENNRFIPPNRREIIDLATHYWENDQDAKKRKFSQMKDGDKPSRSTQKKKSSHPTSDKPRQNPMGSDGKRTTCKSLCPDNPCSGLSRESRYRIPYPGANCQNAPGNNPQVAEGANRAQEGPQQTL